MKNRPLHIGDVTLNNVPAIKVNHIFFQKQSFSLISNNRVCSSNSFSKKNSRIHYTASKQHNTI